MGKKFIFLCLTTLVCFNIVAWSAVFEVSRAAPLGVTFFDVGQGDAILVEFGAQYQILIDGGPGGKILEKLSQEMPFWDRSLDLVVLTHPEKDHLEGLIQVLEAYQVDYVLWTGVIHDTDVFREWQRVLEKEGAKIKIADRNKRFLTSRFNLEILFPFENLENVKPEDSNETSIVLRLIFQDISFLFTGDIYEFQEKKLMEKEINIDSDVLKLAHHGSKTSSSEMFINSVSPQIAVAQVGRNNPYGHPHEQVVNRMKEDGIKLLRTDQDGDIRIISDGTNLAVSK